MSKKKNDVKELVKVCCGEDTCMYKALSQRTVDLMGSVKVQVWSSACSGEMGIEFAPAELEELVKNMDSELALEALRDD